MFDHVASQSSWRFGHWLPLERTKEVNAALLDFLYDMKGRVNESI
jgi:hypothetical protein